MTRHTWFRLDRHDDPAPVDPAPVVEPTADPKPSFDGDFDPARAAKLIENLRTDLAAAKAKAGTAAEDAVKEINAKLAKVFGGDDADDPEAMAAAYAERAATAEARVWTFGVKSAVYDVAADAGANAKLVFNSNEFRDQLDDLVDDDPDTPAFRETITQKIKDFVAKNPEYAAAQRTTPRPDPGQGGRPEVAIDYTTASREDFAKEAAKYRLRPRQY